MEDEHTDHCARYLLRAIVYELHLLSLIIIRFGAWHIHFDCAFVLRVVPYQESPVVLSILAVSDLD